MSADNASAVQSIGAAPLAVALYIARRRADGGFTADEDTRASADDLDATALAGEIEIGHQMMQVVVCADGSGGLTAHVQFVDREAP